MVDTSDEWITALIGIKERRILTEEGLGTSYMARKAAKQLCRRQVPTQTVSIWSLSLLQQLLIINSHHSINRAGKTWTEECFRFLTSRQHVADSLFIIRCRVDDSSGRYKRLSLSEPIRCLPWSTILTVRRASFWWRCWCCVVLKGLQRRMECKTLFFVPMGKDYLSFTWRLEVRLSAVSFHDRPSSALPLSGRPYCFPLCRVTDMSNDGWNREDNGLNKPTMSPGWFLMKPTFASLKQSPSVWVPMEKSVW